ncbi:magnesium transporter CorA family protein [Caulobacter sp. ErkDOM-E]|uniref:magnesium transporter CorA family protein n=1 Tax=Caulobacter sp. ErkDOM-E TaxID=3402778 RepID=UPI003AF97E2C
MLRILRRGAPGFETGDAGRDWRLPDDAVWIELVDPSRAEEVAVEQAIGVLLPTREEMAEIEASSRLYQEDGGTFMTATVLVNADGDLPTAAPVTFVLVGQRLITIRYVEPRAFSVFAAQAERQPSLCPNGPQTFLGLLDAVVDRTADILERTASEVEAQSRAIFSRPRGGAFEQILNRLGRAQNINAKARDSLVSLARLLSFASLADQFEGDRELRDHLKSLQRDVQSITDHSSYVSSNITFLLDAALGLINIEQNAIFKIFSVFSAVFLPPTLIAGVYGMNFEHMPELRWMEGYPMALGMMFAAGIGPLLWFKRKGWL